MRKTIFHEDWWFNTVAPERWGEVRTERGYLRYAYNNRMMFRSSQTPALTRIVGPVIQIEGKKMESRQRAIFSAVCELLDELPDFDFIRLRLDTSVADVMPFQSRGYQATVQHTFHTDCRLSEEAIWAEMRDKTRNIIRRAQDSLSVVEIEDPEIFRNFYEANLENEKSYFGLELIPAIYRAAHSHGNAKILAAIDQKGAIHAQTFFIWDDHSCYYFLSSRNQAIAHAGAVSQLVWAGMQHAHALGLVFDFDGVTSQSRYQFLVGFGGKPANRFIVSKGALLYDAQASARAFSNRLIGRAAATF